MRPRLVVIGGRDGENYVGTHRIADRLARVLPCAFLVTGTGGKLVADDPQRRLRALVAIDRSPASDAALAELRELRGAIPLDCEIVSFYWPPEEQARLNLPRHLTLAPDPLAEGILIGEIKQRIGELPGEGDVTVSAKPIVGSRGLHISDVAQSVNADFVLVGSHQRTAVGSLFHGSVTHELLHDAEVPVWFAPLSAREPRSKVSEPRRVLVATDLSDFGNRAIAFAYSYLRNYGGTVDILHVLSTESEERLRSTLERSVRPLGRPTELAMSMLQSLVPDCAEGYQLSTEIHVVAGEAIARHIADHAKATKADVICVAAHGAGMVRKAVVGSVATDLAHLADRPVLLVR